MRIWESLAVQQRSSYQFMHRNVRVRVLWPIPFFLHNILLSFGLRTPACAGEPRKARTAQRLHQETIPVRNTS